MALPMGLDDGSEQRIREIEAEYTEFLDDVVSYQLVVRLLELEVQTSDCNNYNHNNR